MATREGATRQKLTASIPPILITETYQGGRWVVTSRVRQPYSGGKSKMPLDPRKPNKRIPAPSTRSNQNPKKVPKKSTGMSRNYK